MSQTETAALIRRVAVFYERSIICPAEVWIVVADLLTTDTAAGVLGRLPADVRAMLRRVYHGRPWSLRNDQVDSEVRREIESWCLRPDG